MQRSLASFDDVASLRQHLDARLLKHQKVRVAGALRDQRILIADETGMGKTAAMLACLEGADAFPAVIVTPAPNEEGILTQCRKWLPWRSSAVVRDSVPSTEIVVLHPETLETFLNPLFAIRPKALVLDESHFFKNRNTRRGAAARSLASQIPLRILMSATPIKNQRQDLHHQLDLLGRTHEVLAKAYQLAGRSLPPLDTQAAVATALRKAPRESLHRALEATVMYRTTHAREKSGQAPIRRHQVQCADGASDQYRRLEEQFVAYCREMSLLTPNEKKERAQARIRASGMINGLRAALGAAKVVTAVDWATRLNKRGRRGVLFCYHRHVAHLLGTQLPGRVLTITGDIPPTKRQAIVDDLGKASFLVATMDSLAHGVNGLERHASDVAFAELDYTHSKHEQSEGRLRRLTQTGKVQAYYLVAAGTFDEAMLATLRKKWRDASGILDGQASLRADNFAERVLDSIIAQRPWEKGGKVDWSAAGGAVRRGATVQKPGRNGPLTGTVIWLNGSETSCRVEWSDGLVTFEVPDQLRVLGTPKSAGRGRRARSANAPVTVAA